jgi:hypothetical protein
MPWPASSKYKLEYYTLDARSITGKKQKKGSGVLVGCRHLSSRTEVERVKIKIFQQT